MSTTPRSEASAGAPKRAQRRTLVGRVTSIKMASTITVLVERTFKHPKYGKFVRKNKAYHAHDGEELAREGDLVEIMASRPISKLKRWRLVRVVEAAPDRGAEVAAIEAAESASTDEAGAQDAGGGAS